MVIELCPAIRASVKASQPFAARLVSAVWRPNAGPYSLVFPARDCEQCPHDLGEKESRSYSKRTFIIPNSSETSRLMSPRKLLPRVNSALL